jgi:hypothetical protein
MKFLFFVFTSFVFSISLLHAAPQASIQKSKRNTQVSKQKTEWLLGKFLELSRTRPQALLAVSEKLIDPNRVRLSTVDLQKAHEWQHRLAAVSALSDLFRKRAKGKKQVSFLQKKKARELITRTLIEDPSLLVRDGAAEAIRRINRFDKLEARNEKIWQKSLETSFMSQKNSIEGEGLFIKETILMALKEIGKPLPNKIVASAKKDKNRNVSERL